VQARPIRINEELRRIGLSLQASFDWLEVEIRYNLDDRQDAALIDDRLLAKSLERLAEEMISRCTEARPVRLTLVTQGEDGWIQILVESPHAEYSDEMIALLDDALATPQVFEPELREFSLALLLVKGIIHYHDGHVSVARGPARGLTFVVSLPAFGR
jgi:hypothetical protein